MNTSDVVLTEEQTAVYVRMSRLLIGAGFGLVADHGTQQVAEDSHGRRAVMTRIGDGSTEVEMSYRVSGWNDLASDQRIDLAYDPETLQRVLAQEIPDDGF